MKIGKILAATTVSVAALGASAMANDGRYIILMKNNRIPSSLEADVAAAGGAIVRTLPQVGVAIATSADAQFIANASAIAGVAKVGGGAADTLPATTDAAAPEAGGAAFSDAGLMWGIDRVHAPEAWANGYTGDGATVAIIDTGVAWNHPDLASNVVSARCFTSAGTDGGDFTIGGCNPYPEYSDHGTHTAGTAAANFGGGAVGVAPDAKIASYNTFEVIPDCGVCSYTDSRWAAMIDAADLGYDVISMSLGGTAQFGGQGTNDLATYVAAEKRVANYVAKQGTLMVASAGNSGLDLNGTIIHVPGDIPQILNVGATGVQPAPRYPFPNSFDIRAFYSNYGAPVGIAGPGGDCGQIDTCDSGRPANWFEYLILSTTVAADPACAATFSCAPGWGWKGGTSMATPHVSGVAALVKAKNPGMKPNALRALLTRSAENIGSRQEFGHGMVRADKATQ
ncbi:MAG: S8 family serine peptidase [Parvularculaceae bacterium]|nr:S8 family serine peptidase [Parvularculaceae bacterium]